MLVLNNLLVADRSIGNQEVGAADAQLSTHHHGLLHCLLVLNTESQLVTSNHTPAALRSHTRLLWAATRSTSGPVSSLTGLLKSAFLMHASSAQSSQKTPQASWLSASPLTTPAYVFHGLRALLEEPVVLPEPCLSSCIAAHDLQQAGEALEVNLHQRVPRDCALEVVLSHVGGVHFMTHTLCGAGWPLSGLGGCLICNKILLVQQNLHAGSKRIWFWICNKTVRPMLNQV